MALNKPNPGHATRLAISLAAALAAGRPEKPRLAYRTAISLRPRPLVCLHEKPRHLAQGLNRAKSLDCFLGDHAAPKHPRRRRATLRWRTALPAKSTKPVKVLKECWRRGSRNPIAEHIFAASTRRRCRHARRTSFLGRPSKPSRDLRGHSEPSYRRPDLVAPHWRHRTRLRWPVGEPHIAAGRGTT